MKKVMKILAVLLALILALGVSGAVAEQEARKIETPADAEAPADGQ